MKEIEKRNRNYSKGNYGSEIIITVNLATEDKHSMKTTSKVLSEALGFYDAFQIEEILNPGNPKQQLLFSAYFARYFLLKRGYETERLLKQPGFDAAKKVPLLGRLAISLERKNATEIKVSKLLEQIIEDTIEDISENKNILNETTPSTIERMANLLSTTFLEHYEDGRRDFERAIEGVKNRFRPVERQ